MAVSRWQGKLGGNHATLIECAWDFINPIIRSPAVDKICPSYIAATGGRRRSIKIYDEGGCVRIMIHGSAAHQEVRLYTDDVVAVKALIHRAGSKAGFEVR